MKGRRRFGVTIILLLIASLILATIIYSQEKLEYLINTSPALRASSLIKEANRIYYIHIGKTGGYSLFYLLDIDRKKIALPCRLNITAKNASAHHETCYRPRKGPEPALSSRVMGHFHMLGRIYTAEERQWLLNHTDAFLFPVRDPVDRIVSAFNYHHNEAFRGEPQPRSNYSCPEFGESCPGEVVFYLDCFGNVEDLAQSVAPSPDPFYNYTNVNAATDTCRTLGTKILQGYSGTGQPIWSVIHLYLNYRYYLSQTIEVKPQHRILVVRTEHMWDDIRHLEHRFGGDANRTLARFAGESFSHGSEKYHLRSGVSSSGRRSLCCALHDDMEAYQRIVLGADNLGDMQKWETLLSLYRKCGVTQSDFAEDFIAYPFSWVEWHRTACDNATFY